MMIRLLSHCDTTITSSFISLACAEFDDSLPFSGASSIRLSYVIFPAILPHQLFFHPLSPHLAIYFLVYLSILLFPNSYLLREIRNHIFYIAGGLARHKTPTWRTRIFNQGLLPYTTCFHHSFQSVVYPWFDFGLSFSITSLLLLVFSPWAGLGRDQSSVRRLVWLWYAASWASSYG